MQPYYQSFLTLVNCLSCFTNASTMIYILKTFDVRIHVFALLFIDSIISTSCSLMATTIRILASTNILNWGFHNCSALFFSIFLPTYYGGILTFLVAAIRFILAKQSAQNIQVSNSKVFLISFSTFLFFATLTGSFVAYFVIQDIPFVIIVEFCSGQKRPVGWVSMLASRYMMMMFLVVGFKSLY